MEKKIKLTIPQLKIDHKQVREILLGSTFHGIPNLVRNNNRILKSIWLICFILSSSICIYFLKKAIVEYLNFNKVSKIDVIYEEPAEFPTISICDRDIHNLSLDNIIACEINKDLMCFENKEDFFEVFSDPHYNDCLRFNSGRNIKNKTYDLIKSSYSGKTNGFWLDLNINPLNDFSKVIVYIHNSTMTPFGLFNIGVDVSPGRLNHFKVERIFTKKLEEPYNNCLKDPLTFNLNKTLIDYIIGTNRSYSQKECLNMCFNLKYLEENPCNCTSKLNQVYEKCFENYDYYSRVWNCSLKFRKKFSKNILDQECPLYCPLECDSVSYSVSVFNIDLPNSGNISERDQRNWFDFSFQTYEEVQKNFYSIVIYYEDLKYTEISENPSMDISDLISNVGGILGVFLGFSFLSLIEIIELLFTIN
jgi:hypothetical protein